MDTETHPDSTVSIVDGNIGESSTYNDQEDNPYYGDLVRESSRAAEFLPQLELDIACSTERLVNLNILLMHVASRANDIEDTRKDETLGDSTEKVLEFDFLSEIFNSEVRELSDFIAALRAEVLSVREMMSSGGHLEGSLAVLLERLDDSERSLKQSQEEISNMRTQYAQLRRVSSTFREVENIQEDKDAEDFEDVSFLHNNAKIKMQTSEQQRHVLRLLEKSLAMELDLEKKLMESRQVEEELKSKLNSSAHEVLSLEEQATEFLQMLFEADSAAVVLKGITRELMGRLHLSQFNMNGAGQREAQLKSWVETSQALTLKEKAEMTALREKIVGVESRAESVALKCKVLEETNAKLKEELDIMRNDNNAAETVESLEKELQEADMHLQGAMASMDASEEKQAMLNVTIIDMQSVIDDLKLKVNKAEKRADHAEDKWIILSESNAELNEKLNLLQGKLESSEAYVQRLEEAKAATAKDINARTKIITDLVMRLASERKRLHKQVSFLMNENKHLTDKLQGTKKDQSMETGELIEKSDGQNGAKGIPSIPPDELQKPLKDTQEDEATMLDPTDVESKLKMARTIDAGRLLGFKKMLFAILVLLLAGLATWIFNQQSYPF